jgi:copper chaperone
MLRFHVPNMACGGCARSVTRAMSTIDPKARIEIDRVSREVRIDTQVNEQSILAALGQAGFPAERRS